MSHNRRTEISQAPNITCESPYVKEIKPFDFYGQAPNTDGFLTRIDDVSLRQQIGDNDYFPVLAEANIRIRPARLCERFVPKASRITQVFLDVFGSVVVFDVSSLGSSGFSNETVIGDGMTASLYVPELRLDIDTVEYFGERPTFLRKFDQVERPHILVDVTANVTIEFGGALRVTSATPQVHGNADAETTREFAENITVIGYALDIRYVE